MGRTTSIQWICAAKAAKWVVALVQRAVQDILARRRRLIDPEPGDKELFTRRVLRQRRALDVELAT